MRIYKETERLLLREILPDDLHGLYELDSNPEVHKYLGNKPITSIEHAKDAIQYIRNQYKDHGIGRWAVIDKSTSEFMGWAGLKLVTKKINDHISFYDLGYRLIPRYWGKGIATEASLASLDYGFNELELTTIYGMADCDNAGSNKVLRKVGLSFINEFEYDGIKHNWYEITKKQSGF